MLIDHFLIIFSFFYILALYIMIAELHSIADKESKMAILDKTYDASLRRIKSNKIYELSAGLREVDWDYRGFELWMQSRK